MSKQKGFAHAGVLVLLVVVLAIGGAGYLVYSKQRVKDTPAEPTPEVATQKKQTTNNGVAVGEKNPASTTPYTIDKLGVIIQLEDGWTAKPTSDTAESYVLLISKPDTDLAIKATAQTFGVGFEGCEATNSNTYIDVNTNEPSGIAGVNLFGYDGPSDRHELTLVSTSLASYYATENQSGKALLISDIKEGSRYYYCSSGTPPVGWSVDFDNNKSNHDGIYVTFSHEGGLSGQLSTYSGYDDVLKMMKSVTRK
jgi:hypothetical protein